AGLALTHGQLWAVAATAAMPTVAIAAFYVTAYFALRLLMAWSVARWALGGRVVRKWWLLPVRDALALGGWGAALFKNRIHWRGREFVLNKGRLLPVAGAMAASVRASDVVCATDSTSPIAGAGST